MAEDLEEVLRKFVLSEKEAGGIQIEGEDVLQSLDECKRSVIGKVFGDKVAHIAGVRSFASNMWIFAKNLRIVEIGIKKFQFIFDNMHDREKVLGGRPWVYDNQPLILVPWKEGIETKEGIFTKTWIWMQIWNLPMHWISKEAGKKIGSICGAVKEIIVPTGGGEKVNI